MALATSHTTAPANQAQVEAYHRIIAALASDMKPKALARTLERLRHEAEGASSATVIPLRGHWRETGNRQAYGAALTDIINKLEKCS